MPLVEEPSVEITAFSPIIQVDNLVTNAIYIILLSRSNQYGYHYYNLQIYYFRL